LISRAQTRIRLQTGSKYAYLNDKKVLLPVKVSTRKASPGPVKFIAEALGAAYSWDAKSKTAAISLKDKYIAFPDKKLDKVIRAVLNKPSGDLPLSEMKRVKLLDASDYPGISDLNGIQYLTELDSIFIAASEISDISRLQSLKRLHSITITQSKITDISALSSLGELFYLNLTGNSIKDLTPLKGLKKLLYLTLEDNLVSDISPLLELPQSTEIFLWHAKTREELNIVYKAAREITGKVLKPSMNDLEKELALHDYLVTNTEYDRVNFNNGTVPEESHHALSVFTKGVGVCDGYSEAMQILLSMAGIESRVVLGESTGPGGVGHAWNMVRIDGDYYQLDTTYNDPISNSTEQHTLSHIYFNISDSQLSFNHLWDGKLYPECKKDNPQFATELERLKDRVTDGTAFYMVDNYALYRIDSDGKFKKLCNDRVSDISLYEGWIFYINQDDSGKVYKIRTDGTGRMKVADYSSHCLVLENKTIFLMNETEFYRMDVSGTDVRLLAKDDVLSYFILEKDWIYYKSYNLKDGARLYRMKTDGSSRSPVFDAKPGGFRLSGKDYFLQYSIAVQEIYSEGYIYFINESDSYRLYRSTMDGTSVEKLSDDRVSGWDIEIAGGWIYYRNENDSNKYYRVRTDGSEKELAAGQK
jgi:hypothetical protein